MIGRRPLIRDLLGGARVVAAVAVVAGGSLLPAAHAEVNYQRFMPALVELPGWEAEKPDGMAMEMAGATMVTASRHYQRGDARIDAQIVTGSAAQVALAATSTDMKIESGEGRMSSDVINGFKVTRTYTFSDQSGGIIVSLGEQALFSLSFSGIDDAEALAVAKRFDWKSLKSIVSK